MAAIQALQQWCKKQCEGYKDVRITNMTTSFRDGLAFCAILHRHRPELIDFSALRKENVFENNQLAFQVAEKELGIPALLDAEDMVALKVPDRLSILTYVSQYYNYFHGRSPIGGMSGVKRPSSDPAEEPKEKKAVSEPARPAPAKPPRVHVPPEPKTNLIPQERHLVKENPPATGAFQVAEKELGIPALLDAEDMVALKVPDRLSILTYVSQYYNYFHGRSPIGGMSGVKRPSSDPAEEPKEKKAVSEPARPAPAKPPRVHVPPEPKTNLIPQERHLVKENPPATGRQILVETSNTRSSDCAVCGTHVHLVQRHLVDGKLYHRNCFRCKQCSNTLTSGAYKAGTEPGTLICTRHEEPNHLHVFPSSRAVRGENKSTSTTSASGIHLKGPESKNPTQEPLKTNQVLRNSSFAKPWEPSYLGTNKSGSVSTSPISRRTDPAGDKTDHLKAGITPAPSHWTAASAKTQQAREKFFQSGLGSSGLSSNKVEPVKNHVSTSKASEAAWKTSFPGASVAGMNSGSSEKDKARNVLMHVIPGPSTTGQRGSPGAQPRLLGVHDKSSPTSSGFQRLEPKDAPDVSKPTGGGPRTAAPNLPKAPCHNVGTAVQNPAKDQPISRPVEAKPKVDVKVSKVGGPGVTEEKSESPADWRSRLKPVGTKFSHQGDARNPAKPADVQKPIIDVTPSSAPKESKPALPKVSVTVQDPAPSADQPQKKRLLVSNLDVTSGWQKPRQQWEDSPALREVEELSWPKKAIASVKPSAPEPFRKLPSISEVSPSKFSSEYIPEDEIQKEVQQIERDLDDLELKGVDMEKNLRACEGDDREDALMVEWFKLIHEKQLLLRRESELMYRSKQQKLEEKQWSIETQLRNLMNKPEYLKTPKDKVREEELLKSYLAIIDGRNEIVENLDEDRIREMEEDKEMAALIRKLDVPRSNQESEKKKVKFDLFKMLKIKS